MSSIQERLQQKRVPLDTWNIREQLCLASAVVRSGDQNWMSVSRALKTVGEPNRPPDWYSQKSCAAQYGALLEHVETPKRKKRNSEGGVETPQESILKKLTQERIVEIQKTIADMNQQYDQIKNEIAEVRNPSTPEDRIREMWSSIEAAKRARERDSARLAAALKEREERRARAERGWRPTQPTTASPGGTPAPPSSPLLTSLLKSSPVVTTPQHIPHPASVVDTMSPSVTAPTLSMLLEKSAASNTSQHESKHAAIEHIKSQLVQIEQQLKASTTPPPSLPAAAPDIDDIEIKAEDVYAFRDIDIHIPPVTPIHKNNRTPEKTPPKKDDVEVPTPLPVVEPTTLPQDIIKEEPDLEHLEEGVVHEEVETPPEEASIVEEAQPPPERVPEVTTETEVRIAFPEVKFPTTEIKVIHPEDLKVKEEVKEPEVLVEETKQEEVEVVPEEVPVNTVVEDVVVTNTVEPQPELPAAEEPTPPPVVEEAVPPVEQAPDPESIPLPPEPTPEEKVVEKVIEAETPLPTEPEVEPPAREEPPPEVKVKEEAPEVDDTEHSAPEVTSSDDKTEDGMKKDEDAEDSIPLKQMLERVEAVTHDAHDTDDDTPMELVREEDKDGKKRRDYSRKKKSDSRTCSGSESAAEASAPESPSATDGERQHRLWKKSVMLVYSRLCAHKYASLFLRPISDEEAPGYSVVVKRPMDLTTIRRNIESGVIRTTAEFQRDVLLMLCNALMYNSSEHSVYTMAKEMHEEAACQLGMLLAAQAHAGLSEAPPRRKRRRADSPRLAPAKRQA